VVDVPDDAVGIKVTEELWSVVPARRFMVWGTFDRWLVATLPAKDLRSEMRKPGRRRLSPVDKGKILEWTVERWLSVRTLPAAASPWPSE
jgi:hypothetical protein